MVGISVEDLKIFHFLFPLTNSTELSPSVGKHEVILF